MHHHGTKAEPKDLFNFNLVFKIHFTSHATLSLHYRWHQKKKQKQTLKDLMCAGVGNRWDEEGIR